MFIDSCELAGGDVCCCRCQQLLGAWLLPLLVMHANCSAVPALLCLLCSMEAAKVDLLAALDEAERQSGGELTGSNDKGWEVRMRPGLKWRRRCCWCRGGDAGWRCCTVRACYDQVQRPSRHQSSPCYARLPSDTALWHCWPPADPDPQAGRD